MQVRRFIPPSRLRRHNYRGVHPSQGHPQRTFSKIEATNGHATNRGNADGHNPLSLPLVNYWLAILSY